MPKTIESIKNLDKLKETFDAIMEEMSRVIIGQQEVVKQILIGMLCDANVLLESYPGLGKTLMIKTLAQTMDLKFSRIQHTPDLMPSDITGTYVIEESSGKKQFKFQPGPIFANIVLADEINRATPKTQSALLEAMQEKQVTVGNDTYILEKPFFVLATQNPIEQEGSLALDQAVLVGNQLKTGKELLESAQHHCIAEDEKGIRLYQLHEDAVSLTTDGKLQKAPCLLYTLPYTGEMITITTRTGKRLTVTKNHPFLVNNHGIMVWKKAEELTKEDYLVSPAKLSITPQKPVSHEEALVKIQRSVGDMPRDISYDKDFAFWIACILSDGSVDRRGVEFWQKNYPEALERFVSLSQGYGLHPLVNTSRGCRYVRINSRSLVQYLEARFGIRQGKEKEIPQSFLGFPDDMNREFLRAFIALESSLRDNRIVFTQKSASNVNIISYMLLREGILPWIRRDGRIFRLKIQGKDVPQYLGAVGWLSADKMKDIILDREIRSSFRVVPVHRGRILKLVQSLGLNSFHTLPGRKKLVSCAWYGSYKGIKEGESVMSVDALHLFVGDMKEEIRLRKSADFISSGETSPRQFAAGVGMPMADISAQLHVSKNQVWKLYGHPGGTGAVQVSIREFLREAYSTCMAEAEQLVRYCEGLLSEDIHYDRIKSIAYADYDGLAFGLTVPGLQNYVAGFGGCGISHNTYPLPEAQVDRFLFKVLVTYPSYEEEVEIVNRYTSPLQDGGPKPILSGNSLKLLQELTRQVPIADDIKRKAVSIVTATRMNKDLILYGASPRASIGLILAAKGKALMEGRKFVSLKDVYEMAFPVLRHRIILNFEAEREGKTPDDIVKAIISKVT